MCFTSSPLPHANLSQVEFYFSAHNLSTDEHLFFQIDGPDNRTVPIKHIHSFKRMKRFQPYSAVVKALKDSEQLDVVEDGNFRGAGNEGVKRKIPLEIPGWDREKDPDATLEKLFDMLNQHSKNEMGRSIYAKGFGEEHNGQIELEDYFKAFGAVMVRKRRFPDTGEWKGSVFVEFDSEESQAAFLALDPKPKFHGLELEVMDKKAYSKMKCDQKGIIPNWERDNSARRRGGRGQRGGNRGGNRGGRGGRRNDSRSRSPRGSGDEDRDDWKDRRNKFQNKGRWNNRDRDGKGHNKGRRDDRDRDGDRGEKDHGLNRDDGGVPGVADTRKRKVEDGEEKENGSKKAKVEISEDA
ncbi:hypothetical protein BCR34DRAFT_484815 [Clohesyomyces aquaticus]|uniref:RRM domain-containing protein n=1 Tax=Clohesyomyces aquaticus TaxID=1231657 RepID=A0A1Y1ZLH9_9PLEO|nr:hypothetical protein BCR34DRAFT_484815 [Clohesyomyces aquaticus]